MAPPSRDQIEQMAFMAMMDGIIHTSVPCNCATCKSESRTKGGARSQPPKRATPDNQDTPQPLPTSEAHNMCNHNHSPSSLKPLQSAKKATNQNKSNSASNNPARSDKVNALLKAENVQAVFDVFNLTSTSKDEKDLATRIQNATKDCKLYQETKDKILELCDDENVDLDAVFGLLAKFRYERNMLTTAVIKGNNEREKALLCIQRVDHLMYMLQDVAKKKDSKGTDVMHKLGDIIMEIHDLAKTPSSLYDEYLDIKEEHFDLLNDHEEMHQKFVDVNSCHEKLHSSHDKLQTDHSKLLRELSEMKKKASTIGGLKNDVSRLEKAADKNSNEVVDLKKEIERLNSELAKVNALKHENAQLKKKIATLSAQPPPAEEMAPAPPAQTAKKKKGKKGTETSTPKAAAPEAMVDSDNGLAAMEKAHEAQLAKLKKAHDSVTHELELVRSNLKQLDSVLRKAENARDQATEKLEVEKATSRNWKDIAKGHSNERDRLQAEVDRHLSRATRLQSAVEELEQTLSSTKVELAERTEAHKQVKEELDHRSPTPAVSVASHQAASVAPDTIRLLRKIRSETGQLVRELDDSRSYGGDIYALLDMISLTVRRVASEVERDIEEILSVKGNDPLISAQGHVPEAILPFAYNNLPVRQPSQVSPRPDFSPHESPQIPPSTLLPPYRPMQPPPGFPEPASNPFNHTHAQPQSYGHSHTLNRNIDSPSIPFSRMAEPPGLTSNLGFNRVSDVSSMPAQRYNPLSAPSSTSLHSHSSLHSGGTLSNPNVGVIGSRSASSKLNNTPSPISTPAPSAASGSTTSNAPSGASGLGNGAVGVDWNMWARSGR